VGWTFWIICGSISAAISVMMGAFGAHALKSRLEENLQAVFETACRYQMYHSLGLILIGLVSLRVENLTLRLAGIAMMLGILGFSGSLYAYVFTQNRSFAMITPIGGVFFAVAWLLLAWSVLRLS
jgi:uncharacterized membrane protein YgdD (TMEM256/DUF423 family)